MRANIATFIVFLLLLIGAGAAYIWYMQNETIETDERIWKKVTPKKLTPRPIESIRTASSTAVDTLEPEIQRSLDESVERVGGFFTSTIQGIYIKEVGQPIEGFEPGILMSHFAGMFPEDFEGVAAEQGVYRLQDGEVMFEENDEPKHSAGGAITDDGMKTLLKNIAARTELPVSTGSEVEELIESLR